MKEVFGKPVWELGVPIKSWVTDLETGAFAQAINLANLPFVYKHIALMPDAHQGYGMPIGGVMATEGVVVPNAVGVDIGCGMLSVNTHLNHLPDLKKIMSEIRRRIPLGFKKHSKNQLGMPCHNFVNVPIVHKEYSNAQKSLGTLGGGNHFIEFQRDEDTDLIHIMLHSGSRNMGTKVANHYNDVAKDLNHRYFANVPPEWQLAFLPLDSEEGQAYIREMDFCVEYALRNRKKMMDVIFQILVELGNYQGYNYGLQKSKDSMINIAHNYATMEHHFGKNVMVHRKGATLARKDTHGIIPGSQGTKSYIVRGLGNPESFDSCSHGAGRKMGRKQAQKDLDLTTELKKLDDQGIIHSIRGVKDLDEASGAYKDIDEVMENQKDLVTIEKTLKPIAVIKG
jgi:tRNA-splicing ligase RtcB